MNRKALLLFVSIVLLAAGLASFLFILSANADKMQRQQREIGHLNEDTELIQRQVDHLCTVVSSMMLYNAEVSEESLSVYEFDKAPKGDYVLCLADFNARAVIATYYSPNKEEKTRFVRLTKVPKDALNDWPWHGLIKLPLE